MAEIQHGPLESKRKTIVFLSTERELIGDDAATAVPRSRSQLVRKLCDDHPELTLKEVERVVSAFFDSIIEQLQSGGRIELRGFAASAAQKRPSVNPDARLAHPRTKPMPPAAGPVAKFMDKKGSVDVDRVAEAFRMSKGQLADTAGLATATLSKSDRRTGKKAQNRMTEMLEIISRIGDWAGGEAQAMAWYRSQPIPALDGRTPEALVKAGRAAAVRDYLDHLALGGFA